MARKLTKDGRLILSGNDYTKLRRARYTEQDECCADCGAWCEFESTELHHIDGRGLGGGKRDDRATRLLCIICHRKYDKGWITGKLNVESTDDPNPQATSF